MGSMGKIIIGAILFIIVIFAFNYIYENKEQSECIKWTQWELEYPNFNWTDWQKEQCSRYGLY